MTTADLVRPCAVAALLAAPLALAAPQPRVETTTVDDLAAEPPVASPAPLEPSLGTAASTAELAVDTDYEFFLQNGADVDATIAAVEDLLGLTRSAFLDGPGVTFEVTAIVVRDTPDDPYTSTDAAGVFAEARGVWSASDIPHDAVALISGKNFSGGVLGLAGIEGLCTDDGIAVVAPSAVDPAFGPLLLAHELGHVFGAPHCDSAPDCNIMCAFLAGCGPADSFGQPSIDAILGFIADNGACLDAGGTGCNPADVADPFGVLDLADVQTWATAFQDGDLGTADLDSSGNLDLYDVFLFIEAFLAGCP